MCLKWADALDNLGCYVTHTQRGMGLPVENIKNTNYETLVVSGFCLVNTYRQETGDISMWLEDFVCWELGGRRRDWKSGLEPWQKEAFMLSQEYGLGCKWWGSIKKTFKGDEKVMHVLQRSLWLPCTNWIGLSWAAELGMAWVWHSSGTAE